jgi:hypothetical protein
MKQLFYILAIMVFLTACNQGDPAGYTIKKADARNAEKLADNTTKNEQTVKRLSFKTLSEIDTSYTIWVEKQDSGVYSLSLHFMYKDTLAIAYSTECWLLFPYKIDNNKIVVYWDDYIDTKYEFDIVKAIDKISPKYIGKNFMTLTLINDTTLKATYPIAEIRKKVNSCNKERTFFPEKFSLVQHGEMYD